LKKRDLFWLNRIFIILFIGLIFVGISIYNIVQFNNSYILEEKNELEIYKKQVEFVISSLIKNNDMEQLTKYALTFRDDKEFSFRLFDKNKNLIVASSDNKKDIKNNDIRIKNKNFDVWDLYLHSFHDKNIEKVSTLKINNKIYYLEVSISQEFVIGSIIKAQQKIIILFGCGGLFLILALIHIFYSIRKSFNSLEDSVIKIARGEFDTEIKLPKSYLLKELSFAIIRMTNRLKLQIKRLIQLEKYRSEFVSNISHEIKTPITAINSAVELIEINTQTNGLQRECFEIIKFQTTSITNLVNDILALSEIDLEKTNEYKNFKSVNLNSAVKEAIDNVAIGIDINFNSLEEIEVFGIENLIVTAISNLLTNAIKYSDSETIEVNLVKEKNIIIEVKDYGIGIPEEHLSRIFERFYRVDKNRSRGGTGLGLAIVKHIIELHNWKIEVESTVGQGTSFKIII
jgi:two-component system phosphate regulon sensor histidine kinase PhoR